MRSAFHATVFVLALALLSSASQGQEPPKPPAPDPGQPPSADTLVLPEIVVEAAPAKRNKKKQALRATGGGAPEAGAAGPSVGTGTSTLPGLVVEGEKVVRTLQDTTTSIGVVTGRKFARSRSRICREALNSQANVLATEGSGGNAALRSVASIPKA